MSFFPVRPESAPKIYGYTEPSADYKDLIKVGYTERDVLVRMREHYPTQGPDGIERYKVLFEDSSMRDDGTYFKDYEVHKILEKAGIQRSSLNNEWFKCSVDELKAAVIAAKERKSIDIGRVFNFELRPEQREAVEKTKHYFKAYTFVENKVLHY